VSILVDHQIRYQCVDVGEHPPLIDPFDEDLLQPASYDTRLADRFMAIDAQRRWSPPAPVDLGDWSTFTDLYVEFSVGSDGYELGPGKFVLGHTIEKLVVPQNVSAHVQGKSSIARLGLAIEAAGFIDPGYRGSITLEIANMSPVPIILRPGLPIAQFSFQVMSSEPDRAYGDPKLGSRYQGSDTVVGSRYGLLPDENGVVSTTSFKRYEAREERRPCKAKCGRPFQPDQLYVPDGPYHIGCSISGQRK
jgi:dCTP deaminase